MGIRSNDLRSRSLFTEPPLPEVKINESDTKARIELLSVTMLYMRSCSDKPTMSRYSKFVFLLRSIVAPVALVVALAGVAHANPITRVQAPEFDLSSISAGLAACAGAGWIFLNRFRRNRRPR